MEQLHQFPWQRYKGTSVLLTEVCIFFFNPLVEKRTVLEPNIRDDLFTTSCSNGAPITRSFEIPFIDDTPDHL